MLSTALSLAILTTGGALLIYFKLPRSIRRVIEKYSLLTDVLCLIGIYYLLGGTLTALFAAAMCGVMISALLNIVNHKEDWLFLYDAKKFIMEKLNEAKDAMTEYSKSYKNSH